MVAGKGQKRSGVTLFHFIAHWFVFKGFLGFAHSHDTEQCICYYDANTMVPEADSLSHSQTAVTPDDQICYKYKFEGAWPTVSPTHSPTIKQEGVKQFTNVVVTILTTLNNRSPAEPVINPMHCYTEEFGNLFKISMQGVIANILLQDQQELQAELVAITNTLNGPCQFESVLTVQVTQLCIIGDCSYYHRDSCCSSVGQTDV